MSSRGSLKVEWGRGTAESVRCSVRKAPQPSLVLKTEEGAVKCRRPPEAGERRRHKFSPEAVDQSQPCRHLAYHPVRPVPGP